MTKQQALDLLHAHLQNVNLRKHCYAVGAVMKSLSSKFGGDAEKWEVVGLLHDGDYEMTKSDPTKHTLVMLDWLKEAGVTDEEIFSAIASHNYVHTGKNEPKGNLEWSLYCCDELTGLIIAVSLVRPERTLAAVSVESVMKKWGQKAFAAGVDRNQIAKCEEKLGIKLADFIQIALVSMQQIHDQLGL